MVCIPEQGVTVRHPVLKAPSRQVRHAAEFVNVTPADQPPGQCAFYLQPPVSLAQPGQPTGMTVDQCHNLPPASLPAASLPVQYENTPPALQRYSHKGYTAPPSGVLTTKPHDSAGTHRRACARIADSVCVINRDLLRKFINGKETAKIADIPAQFTPAHALAASVLTDIRGGFIELIRHCPARVTTLIRAVGPHTGVRQHDTTGKQRPVRLGRCGQHKRGRHGCQLRHLLHHPAVTQLLLRVRLRIARNEIHRIQKTGIHPAADHRGPPPDSAGLPPSR
ncbi:hypothetical protein MS10711_1357 [Escherichia coli]|nr:hypothetical protein MS10711_1357 [Escherichia coli]